MRSCGDRSSPCPITPRQQNPAESEGWLARASVVVGELDSFVDNRHHASFSFFARVNVPNVSTANLPPALLFLPKSFSSKLPNQGWETPNADHRPLPEAASGSKARADAGASRLQRSGTPKWATEPSVSASSPPGFSKTQPHPVIF
jgi:hypothetical protein